ncbi:MAG: hypothetical protein HQM10_16985 [Candidatus Riflebacteria bacterium]|nr:hypothetical protein [Candidatus Riflebacteria bacterium]
MDEELQNMPPESVTGKKKKKEKNLKASHKQVPENKLPVDVEAEHKKFMFIMFGLFFFILAVMILFNSHFDFALDGGI